MGRSPTAVVPTAYLIYLYQFSHSYIETEYFQQPVLHPEQPRLLSEEINKMKINRDLIRYSFCPLKHSANYLTTIK
jgi:hypothetical protein